MDRRGDLVSFGRPMVEHTRQSPIETVVVVEHYMHLMAREFFALVDEAAEQVAPSDYATMFAAFVDAYCHALGRSTAPAQYRTAFGELGQAMQRWANVFR
jgi:hypothetical protein